MSYRNNSSLPSSKKTHSEKHKQIFKQLLKESANKTCVDCKTSTHPRWASWNLGCFICIRCSGIHRSMGTHISKVKSVDLDAWTDEQVESMVKWGNERANTYWEAKLPEGYVPDQSKIENFIRTKYDLKKWVSSPVIPNPLTLKGPTKPHNIQSVSIASTNNKSNDLSGCINGEPSKGSESSLLDDDFGTFAVSPSPSHSPSPYQNIKKEVSTPASGKVGHILPINQAQSANSSGGRPDLKKSILSLYSSPSSSSSFIPQNNIVSQNSGQIHSLSNSLHSLNFNNSSIVNNNTTAPNQSPSSLPVNLSQSTLSQTSTGFQESRQPAVSNWNNEWTESSSSLSNQWPAGGNYTTKTSSALNSSALDDDLFKNVWS